MAKKESGIAEAQLVGVIAKVVKHLEKQKLLPNKLAGEITSAIGLSNK